MKILVDHQLPAALARFLATKGHDAEHVLDIGMEEASDVEIWAYASENHSVVVSKDEDFLHLAHARPSDARLIWIRLGNCRKATLLAVFEQLWPRIETQLGAGERIIELR